MFLARLFDQRHEADDQRRVLAQKISTNQARDKFVTRALRAADWRVVRIWEPELTRKNERRLLARLKRHLG
jgi:G:T-mismatch repair DNA endonuclease (very short patch repair protein)